MPNFSDLAYNRAKLEVKLRSVSIPISVIISLEVRQSGEEAIRRRAGMVPRRGERAEE